MVLREMKHVADIFPPPSLFFLPPPPLLPLVLYLRFSIMQLNGIGSYNHGSMRGAQKVAEEYGVSIKTIRDIWTRYSWAKATMHLWTRQEMASYTRHRTSHGHLGGIKPTAAYMQQQQQQQQNLLATDQAAMQHGKISRSSSSGSTTGTPEFWSVLTAAAGSAAAPVVFPQVPPVAAQMPAGQAQMASQGPFQGVSKDSGNRQGEDASGARLIPVVNSGQQQQQFRGNKLQEMILHTQGVLSSLLQMQKVENDNKMKLLQSIHQGSQIKLQPAQGQSSFQQHAPHQKEQQTQQQTSQQLQTPLAMAACTPEAAAMWLSAARAALQPLDRPLPIMTSIPPTCVHNVTAPEARRG